MALRDFFKKKESLVCVDIGSSSIKVIELDLTGAKPKLVNLALSPVSGDVFSNNIVSKVD